jgi:hypothetical protein
MLNENVKKIYLKILFIDIQFNEENVFVKLKFEVFVLRKLKFHHKQEIRNYLHLYIILHFFPLLLLPI